MTIPVYRQIGLPAFQNKTYTSRAAAAAAVLGDVELVQDCLTGLVHNRLFDSGLLLYDENYQNEQAESVVFQDHLLDVINVIRRHFAHLKTGIEIGCGKGFFLEKLHQSGFDVTGFDPAYQGDRPYVIKKYYSGNVDMACDYMILRHVLEHISNPVNFLQQLAEQCNGRRYIFIEVPCFNWIMDNHAFYDIFYEHCNYFCQDFLLDCFGDVLESGHLFGGQYLYIVADLNTFKLPSRENVKNVPPLNIAHDIDRILSRIDMNFPVYIWGAGAKGTTLANLLFQQNVHIEALIDISPAKQNRFVGLSGAPIISPEQALHLTGANVIIMNPMYQNEIVQSIKNFNVKIIEVVNG